MKHAHLFASGLRGLAALCAILSLAALSGCFVEPDVAFCYADGSSVPNRLTLTNKCCVVDSPDAKQTCIDLFQTVSTGLTEQVRNQLTECVPDPAQPTSVNGLCQISCDPDKNCPCRRADDCPTDDADTTALCIYLQDHDACRDNPNQASDNCLRCATCSRPTAEASCAAMACRAQLNAQSTAVPETTVMLDGVCEPCTLLADHLTPRGQSPDDAGCGLDAGGSLRLCYPTTSGPACLTQSATPTAIGGACSAHTECVRGALCLSAGGTTTCQAFDRPSDDGCTPAQAQTNACHLACRNAPDRTTPATLPELGEEVVACLCNGTDPVDASGACP